MPDVVRTARDAVGPALVDRHRESLVRVQGDRARIGLRDAGRVRRLQERRDVLSPVLAERGSVRVLNPDILPPAPMGQLVLVGKTWS